MIIWQKSGFNTMVGYDKMMCEDHDRVPSFWRNFWFFVLEWASLAKGPNYYFGFDHCLDQEKDKRFERFAKVIFLHWRNIRNTY